MRGGIRAREGLTSAERGMVQDPPRARKGLRVPIQTEDSTKSRTRQIRRPIRDLRSGLSVPQT